MAFNVERAEKQVKQLARQSASAAHIAQSLEHYRRQLGAAWSGEECRYIDIAIEELAHRCEKLNEKTDAVKRDMARAIQDILAEEAEDSGI